MNRCETAGCSNEVWPNPYGVTECTVCLEHMACVLRLHKRIEELEEEPEETKRQYGR